MVLVLALVGLLIIGGGGTGAYLMLSGGDSDQRSSASGRLPSPPSPQWSTGSDGSPTQSPGAWPNSSPSAAPRTGTVDLDGDFLAGTVKTGGMTFRRVAAWDGSCTSGAKPALTSVLRKTKCTGRLYGAQYKAPRNTYIQITLLRFADKADARAVSRRISSSAAPVIKVRYGTEPGHWWSAGSVGEYVLIRQSFISGSRNPGAKNGPAEVYGGILQRRLAVEASNVYLFAD